MGRLALFSSCVFDCGIKNDLSASVYVLGHLIEPLKIVLQDVEGTEMTLFNILSCCWGQRWIKKENKILYCHHKRKVKRLWRNWLTFDTWSFSNRSFFYFYTYRICRIIVFSLLSKRSLGNRCWTLYFFYLWSKIPNAVQEELAHHCVIVLLLLWRDILCCIAFVMFFLSMLERCLIVRKDNAINFSSI